MSDDILLVYVTCAGLDEARAIGRALVEEGLAACANIRPHEAIYLWQDQVEQTAEAGLLIKTVRGSYKSLEARIVALHSCTVPCIVAWTAEKGLPAYCDWIRAGSAGRALR